jgi:hypothetical protein
MRLEFNGIRELSLDEWDRVSGGDDPPATNPPPANNPPPPDLTTPPDMIKYVVPCGDNACWVLESLDDGEIAQQAPNLSMANALSIKAHAPCS